MNIHEYQAKKILKSFGVEIPPGKIAYTPKEAINIAREINPEGPWVLKSQIQSGARSKGYFIDKKAGNGSGIRVAKHEFEIEDMAAAMLGSTLVTSQTGPKGQLVSKIYVEERLDVVSSFYLGMVIDRMSSQATILAAKTHDEEIDKLAVSNSEGILKERLDFGCEISDEQVDKVMNFLGLESKYRDQLSNILNAMKRAFREKDAIMLEINPVGLTSDEKLVALDAKISFDDNALFRNKDVLMLKDYYEEDDRVAKAKEYGFLYQEFTGNIGCIVNGDGLAMATMDLLKSKGAATACFLNVKGGVDRDKISSGIKLILTNPRLDGVLINVLGGFLRCNLIADGIISAAEEVGLNVPIVVRFIGTNKDEAKEVLQNTNLPVIIADEMDDAVDKIIKAVGEFE